MTEPFALLLAYCAAIALASVAGGALPNRVRMTHTRTQLAMSAVSGLMLGVAFFHLLPHAIVLGPGPDAIDFASGFVVAGLVTMFLLLRMFHFHQHEFQVTGHDHDHDPDHDRHHQHPAVEHGVAEAHGLSGLGIALGLSVHTVIDGVALGAAVGGGGHAGGYLGAGVFLAVLLHKPLDAMSITALMQNGGWSRVATGRVNLAFAVLCPLAALLFYLGLGGLSGDASPVLAAALAFAAGAFVCIALSDLLPEVHFHSHDRFKLTAVFLAGIILAWLIGGFEPAGAHHLHSLEVPS
ncbi:MAG TPA: ZIP family metal transporter [Pseudohaliea sp.]|nr:ZIP family metal transporter [Pseudohaliea sp.]